MPYDYGDNFETPPETDIKPYVPPSDKTEQDQDFILEKVELIAYNGKVYDVSYIRGEINIYESVFHNCMSGNIVLRDVVDLPMLYPLVGEEKLKIKFTRTDPFKITKTNPDEHYPKFPPFSATFRIYAMEHREKHDDKYQQYMLHFVSEEYIKSLKAKAQMGFKSTKYSTMVEKVYKKYFARKKLIIEETKYKHDFAVPSMSPFAFFNQLASMSISAKGNGHHFVFYEDHKNFNYTSLGRLIKQEPAMKYYYRPSLPFQQDGDRLIYPKNLAMDFSSIENYKFDSSFDVLDNLRRGMYSSKLITVDPLRLIFKEYKYDYKEEFDKYPHLAKHDLWSDKLDALHAPLSSLFLQWTNKDQDKVEWIAAHEPKIMPVRVEKWLQNRKSQIKQLENLKISACMPGDPRRKAGDVINFVMPSSTGDACEERPEELEKYLRGKYLILNLRHKITISAYTMNMDIVKDSFVSAIEHEDITKRYEPIY